MRMRLLLAALMVVVLAGGASAIDRDAKMIDSLNGFYRDFDGGDMIGGWLEGESLMGDPSEKWALIGGVGFGSGSVDELSTGNFWGFELGLKYTFTKLTSMTATGAYTDFATGTFGDTVAGRLGLKHRFLSAERAVSPYLEGIIAYQSVEKSEAWGDSFDEGHGTILGGIDFLMRDDFVIVFEGAYFNGIEAGDDMSTPEGWQASVGMKYYFDQAW